MDSGAWFDRLAGCSRLDHVVALKVSIVGAGDLDYVKAALVDIEVVIALREALRLGLPRDRAGICRLDPVPHFHADA